MAKLQLTERLLHYRRHHDLTQKELGAKIGVSGKTVSHWETGRTVPDPATLGEIAKIYGISSEEFTLASMPDVENFNRASALVGLSAAPPSTALISATSHLLNLIWSAGLAEGPIVDAAVLVTKAAGRFLDSLPPEEQALVRRLVEDVGRKFGATGQGSEGPSSRSI